MWDPRGPTITKSQASVIPRINTPIGLYVGPTITKSQASVILRIDTPIVLEFFSHGRSPFWLLKSLDIKFRNQMRDL